MVFEITKDSKLFSEMTAAEKDVFKTEVLDYYNGRVVALREKDLAEKELAAKKAEYESYKQSVVNQAKNALTSKKAELGL